MKYVVCNYCGGDETELVNEGRDLYLNREAIYRLVRCQNCGLIYQNPRLTAPELLEHYPVEEYELYDTTSTTMGSALRQIEGQKSLKQRHQRIMSYVAEPGHVLDVGCATGSFLAVMRARGWEVTGVELNPEAADYARKRLQLDVRTGMLEEIDFAPGSFDVITMWDVLEHVLDPKATLAECARLLRPNGLLVIGVPNPTSLEARLFGSAWAGWDRPRHLQLFTPVVIRRYLQSSGFSEIHIESFGGSLRVTLLSLGYWLNARRVQEERWRPWLEAAYNLPVRIVTLPVYRIIDAFNQATGMTVFSRRVATD